MSPEPLLRLFANECVMQEVSSQEFIPAPDEVRKTIIFNLSYHGLLDLKAYEDKLANRLVDYEPGSAVLSQALERVPLVL